MTNGEEAEGKKWGRRPTAGQPTAEPRHRPRKERRSSPPFGSEKNVFVLSGAECSSAQPTAGRPLAGRPEAARCENRKMAMTANSTDSAVHDCDRAKWHQLSRFDRHMCARAHRATKWSGGRAQTRALNPKGRVHAAPLGGGGKQPAREPQGNAEGRGRRGRAKGMQDGTARAQLTRLQARVCNARGGDAERPPEKEGESRARRCP